MRVLLKASVDISTSTYTSKSSPTSKVLSVATSAIPSQETSQFTTEETSGKTTSKLTRTKTTSDLELPSEGVAQATTTMGIRGI